MELKYVVLTIIKILISVPLLAILCQSSTAKAAALMGGHLDNNSTNFTLNNEENNSTDSEEIPDPSPLVLPGYNLPENIFNKGKPFYLEKDPLTGQINFNTKTSNDDLYEYIDEEPSKDIHDKSNIDRKDGSLSSHKPSDVNQLTPNFHDFLNLPVKYKSDKYAYPLISSSYANTKIQGNVNRFHNHKDYNVKTSTFKPTVSPTYYTSTPKTMTTPKIYFTSNDDFDDYYDMPTKKNEVFLTTKGVDDIYLTTTTKKTLSLFEQLFGEYDELVTTTEKPKLPALFANLPTNKHKYSGEVKTEKPSFVSSTTHANVPLEAEYQYEDELLEEDEVKHTPTTTTTKTTTTTTATTTTTTKPTQPTPTTFKPKTSLPLGENHVTGLNNNQPIIVATQNLREQLNNEKVHPKPFGFSKPPSTSSIRIPHDQDTISFVVGNHQQMEDVAENKPQIEIASAVTIQPQVVSEASLTIGVPVGGIKQIPGQVMDEKLEINNQDIQFPKGGSKIVFPDDEKVSPLPPPPAPSPPNREILKLSIKPIYHQLPSELTPPREQEVLPPPPRLDRPRPPWDPRPGHFYSGKPEYVRPPRPDLPFKRIDNLPNILPQFRPNMKHHHQYNRQPLLERPSNRPIGFFEKLQPPPPPPKNLHQLRKVPPPPPPPQLQQTVAEDRIINESPQKLVQLPHDQPFPFFQVPPKVVLPNRRIGDGDGDVETLQMIQAKQQETTEGPSKTNSTTTDKPLYVVYPVNTSPIKMDITDTNKKETIVIGTRAESPLPPSKINSIFNSNSRNDSPILKPRPPASFPVKSDFPYPLERPDPVAVPESSNNLDSEESIHWGTVEKVTNSNQISATLKTYTEKPIAVAYTPTENHPDFDKYSMPNYGSPVIPEIRLEDELNQGQIELKKKKEPIRVDETYNDFQAPFQASVNIDSLSQGWAVVRDRNKSTINEVEATTLPLATTSEFDIENFKPQLIGGFKPIYEFAQEHQASKEREENISEREE